MGTCEVLIFDLFGVVIAFDDDLVSRRIAGHCPEPASAFEAMRGLVSDPDLICGRRTLAQLHDALCRAHGLTLDLATFETLWRQPYSQPMPGMAELLRQLSRCHKLLLLSNVDPYYWQVVYEGHAELGYFSECLLSWELGVAKPERAAFAHAVGRAGVPASQCLFIDDKLENIQAAKSLGIEGHHFSGVAALEATLRHNGLGDHPAASCRDCARACSDGWERTQDASSTHGFNSGTRASL